MKKPRPRLARWGLHDLTELPAMSNRSSSFFKPSRQRGQAPSPCRGHQLSPIQSSTGQQLVSVRFALIFSGQQLVSVGQQLVSVIGVSSFRANFFSEIRTNNDYCLN